MKYCAFIIKNGEKEILAMDLSQNEASCCKKLYKTITIEPQDESKEVLGCISKSKLDSALIVAMSGFGLALILAIYIIKTLIN